MLKIKCPVCEKTKRPYGIPRTSKPKPNQPGQQEYEIGTFSDTCSACGTKIFFRMDYVIELAPVDIKEAWAADGTPAEVVEERRGEKKKQEPKPGVERVDEDDITRPKQRRDAGNSS